jgi:hypothetical protein
MLCREANIRHSRVFLSVMFPEPFAQGVIDPGLPPGPGGLEGCQKVAVKADGGGCFCVQTWSDPNGASLRFFT